MMGLGSLYYYGARGMARDQARAFRWFERAALLGDPAGQAAAADLLMKGEGGALVPGRCRSGARVVASRFDCILSARTRN